jgi:hypothetical protein
VACRVPLSEGNGRGGLRVGVRPDMYSTRCSLNKGCVRLMNVTYKSCDKAD